MFTKSVLYSAQSSLKEFVLNNISLVLISCGLGGLIFSMYTIIETLKEQVSLRDIALKNMEGQIAELLLAAAANAQSLKAANQTVETATVVQGYSSFFNQTTLVVCLGIGVLAFGAWYYYGPAIYAYYAKTQIMPDVLPQPDNIPLTEVGTQPFLNVSAEIIKSNLDVTCSVKFVPQSDMFFIKTCDSSAWVDVFVYLEQTSAANNSLTATNLVLSNKMQLLEAGMSGLESFLVAMSTKEWTLPEMLCYLDDTSGGKRKIFETYSEFMSAAVNNGAGNLDYVANTPFFYEDQFAVLQWLAAHLTEML